ncbi:MAG: PP2C family protein-serine/threonine phosphatase [Phycisphaerales bacterium]
MTSANRSIPATTDPVRVVADRPDTARPQGGHPATTSAAAELSFSSFMTDGAIVRLCDELARLAGVPIWLRDVNGKVIVPCEPGSGGDGVVAKAWTLVDHEIGAARAFALVGRAFDLSSGVFVAPLRISAGEIASIVTPADWGIDDPDGRRALERAITLVASTAAELCEDQLALRRRVGELDALFRLSSLLVRAGDPDAVLRAALDLAIDVLRVDAGSISLLDRELGGGGSVAIGENYHGAFHHRASRSLSPRWLAETAPLSVDGVLRSRALSGEVVAVEDIRRDPIIADHTRARHEGLASILTTGLIFQGRAWGLIRLYTRSPRGFTDQERELLRAIADQAAMALSHARLRKLREEDQQIKRQLQLAADVQRRMLPQRLPEVAPFDIAARYSPSFHLGGDFYDAFTRSGELLLAVCDVVGKGVPAALLMSAVRASLRAFVQDVPGLDEVMSRLNAALARDTLESEFATLWLGAADPRTLRLTYCGAGHDPPLVFRPPPPQSGRTPSMADADELTAGGMALGIDPGQLYQLGSFDLRPGDVLVAYTDGVSEASNFDNRKFGRDRIKSAVLNLLTERPGATAAEIVERIIRELRTFCGLRTVHDDVTLVVLRVRADFDAGSGGFAI